MRHPVIVGIDGTDASHDAVGWAAEEARLRGVPLHVVHAWLGETLHASAGQVTQQTRDAGEEALGAAREQARMYCPGLAVTTELVDGYAREALLAASEQADLLVLGARGSGGFSRLLVGSTSLHLSAHALCPVVVVHPRDARSTPGGVLVGVDGERGGEDVLDFAFEAASRGNLPLQAVHAWNYPLVSGPGHALPAVYEEEHVAAERDRLLAEALAGTREKYPDVQVAAIAVRSGAAKLLVTLSEAHQLVVVGRHGAVRGPLRRLGSVSQAVVQHVQCPIAVVPVG
ncbi:nucleotide-binding universal stress UspA family protein [Kitasatospora sp. MAA4]|uniref:universal stress protein n=1 Tax=Kitasatospora sp. MAA4 TaxID=3035093 RepID=UPI0024765391|nr:universal stress protein [Kitasatospora sp. MAA4]MDH6132272.1 nucleotide-binding universal stress UspA family protein [Kitasatospora sp. MAA4]